MLLNRTIRSGSAKVSRLDKMNTLHVFIRLQMSCCAKTFIVGIGIATVIVAAGNIETTSSIIIRPTQPHRLHPRQDPACSPSAQRDGGR